MNFENLRLEVVTYLEANYSTYPVKYENLAFETPKGTPWVALYLKRGGNHQSEFANVDYEVFGILIFQIFTPLNGGSVESGNILDELSGLFQNSEINGIWYGEAIVTDLGGKDSWYQTNLMIPYSRK